MKRLALIAGLALASGIAASTLTGPAAPPAPTYPGEVVAGASAMTQQMSAATDPSDPAHAYHPHAADEQLRLSSDPAFVRQLEGYQAAIDRMLARTP